MGEVPAATSPGFFPDRRGELRPTVAGHRTHYLHPGHVFASLEPHAVSTILGSCVAVCLWDTSRRAGGINHYLLPDWINSGSGASARFGNVALEELVERVLELGSRREDLVAKVFGGACVIDSFRSGEGHLGAANVALARRFLGQVGVPIVAEDVEGRRGRRLVYHTDQGVAWVKLL
jgi:chemotaxis protein CheD